MRVLLDTQVLIWATAQSARLTDAARDILTAPDSELFFSAASIWEIAIKFQRNRPAFTVEPNLLRRALLDNGYFEVAVSGTHAAATASLPLLHKDPFDRLLVAQALHEGLMLLTADAALAAYGGPVRLI